MTTRTCLVTDKQLHLFAEAMRFMKAHAPPAILEGPSSDVYADTLGQELEFLADVLDTVRNDRPDRDMLYGIAL